jgi:VWFA-related protein
MRSYFLISLILLGASAGSAQRPPAQQPADAQSSVTFRAETNFVEVHAIVTDRTGAFVRGLTADDFEVYEGGRLQKPSVFSYIDLPVERPFTPVNASGPIEPDVRETTRTFDGRIYILLMDDLHTTVTRTALVRDTATKFIERYFGTNDLAAVVYTSARQEAGQELTSNRKLLIDAVNRFQGMKLPSTGQEKLAVHLQEALNDQLLGSDDGTTSAPIRTNEGLQKAQATRDPLDNERAFNARRSLQALENVANWLADVQGRRKALLFFSEGLDYDIYQPFDIAPEGNTIIQEAQDATAAAQRANVNIYGVDPRGLSLFGEMIDINDKSDYPQLDFGTFRGALSELKLAQESLISLASETGGLAIVNSGDVVGGLGRIVLDNSRYYVLGYYSDTKNWKSKFLKIDVKVKRPGLQVRARKGFLPPDPKKIAKAREAEVKAGTSPALKAALNKPVPVGDLAARVFAAPFRGTGSTASVLLALEIDGPSLKFEQKDGRYNESLEVSIVAVDEKAKVQGGDRQTFNLKLMPQTYERLRTTGVRLLSRLPLPPGRYQIRVGASESTGGTIATVPIDVEVPDYSKVPFALSGIALTSSAADRLVTANQDPELQTMFSTPPVVTRAFARAETLTAYVEVYDSSKDAHAITVATSVQDAQNGRTAFQTEDRRVVQASSKPEGQGIRTDIPLRDLSAGKYVLHVQATSTAGARTAQRDILFEVK